MPVYDPLDPEAIDSQVSPGLLGQLGRVGLSGVAAAGNFLDTPASMVRDVLSFQNPIDNLLNPFSSANRTGGREMLRKYGLVGEEDTYANWWGGFAAEVALDPLTYLTLGASAGLSGGGKVAKAIGMIPPKLSAAKMMTTRTGDVIEAGGRLAVEAAEEAARKAGTTYAQIADQPLKKALARLQVPFTDIGIDLGTAGAIKPKPITWNVLDSHVLEATSSAGHQIEKNAGQFRLLNAAADKLGDFPTLKEAQEFAERTALPPWHPAHALAEIQGMYGAGDTRLPGNPTYDSAMEIFSKSPDLRDLDPMSPQFRAAKILAEEPNAIGLDGIARAMFEIFPKDSVAYARTFQNFTDFIKSIVPQTITDTSLPSSLEDAINGVMSARPDLMEQAMGELRSLDDAIRSVSSEIHQDLYIEKMQDLFGFIDDLADNTSPPPIAKAVPLDYTPPGAVTLAAAEGLGKTGDYLTQPSKLAPQLDAGASWIKGNLPSVFAKAAKVGVSEVRPTNDLAGALTEHAAGDLQRVQPTRSTESLEIMDDAGKVRIYKPPPGIKEREFLQTLSPDGLLQRQAVRERELKDALTELAGLTAAKADDAARKKAKAAASESARNLDLVNTEISARAKSGSAPKELQDFIKSGQIKTLDILEKNIQDVSKVLPDNPSPEQVSDWAKTSANILTAPGRALAGLFHAPFLGKFDEVEQGIAARRWDLIGKGNQKIRADLSGGISDDIAHYRDAFQENFGKDVAAQLPGHYQNLANAEAKIRAYGESVLRMVGETGSVKEAFLEHGLDPDKIPEQMLGRMNSLLTSLKDVNAKAFGTYMEVGGAGAVLPKLEGEELVGELTEIGYFPGFEHMPRFMADTVSHIWGMIGGGMTRPEGSLSRLEPLRAVPAKIVENIGRLVRTGKAGKLKEEDIITAVADKYGKKWLNKEVAKIDEETGEKILKWGEGDAGIRAHAKALVDWARSSNFDHYMTDNLEANARYLRGIHTATANILAIQEAAQNAAKYAPMVAALPKEQIPKGWRQLRGIATPEEAAQYVSIDKAFSEAGLNAERALKYFAKQLGDDSAEAIAKLKDHVVIPMELAKAIKGSQNIWRLRGYPQMLAQIVDIPTRWFKENVTLPFVSFATRNLGSGLYLIASSGNIESLADLKLYGEKLMEAFDSYRKQNIASEKQREWFVNGVLHEGMIFEGVETRELRSYGHVAPDHINLKEIWGEAGAQVEPSVLDNIPGLRQARQAHGTVLGVGGKANKLIEFLLRVPLYEYLKAKGWNAADASKEVARLQVDYSKHAFSPFENEVMTRLFPFYKWQRSIAPVVLGTLLRKPAGLMGLTVHGSRLASSDDPRTPEWLGDTLAIENPLGSTEEGGRSYVTGFGLPYEPTLAFFGGGLRGAGREALAQLNPLVKAPLEWSTGQSFFQTGPSGAGRPLDELNPPIGQTLANVARVTGRDPSVPVDLPDIVEFAAANSPASRYITTARQITDPRKHPLSLAANLTTGVRVTDVSPEAQDAILRHRASALTRQLGGRTFSQSYFPSGIDLSPAEQGLADQLMELKRLLDQRSRARREAAPTM